LLFFLNTGPKFRVKVTDTIGLIKHYLTPKKLIPYG
jgi:hypothetical protein